MHDNPAAETGPHFISLLLVSVESKNDLSILGQNQGIIGEAVPSHLTNKTAIDFY